MAKIEPIAIFWPQVINSECGRNLEREMVRILVRMGLSWGVDVVDEVEVVVDDDDDDPPNHNPPESLWPTDNCP